MVGEGVVLLVACGFPCGVCDFASTAFVTDE